MGFFTRRPLNRCRECGRSWYPKGQDVSTECPGCGSSRVGIAPTVRRSRSSLGCLLFVGLLAAAGYFAVTHLPELPNLGARAPAKKAKDAPRAAPAATPAPAAKEEPAPRPAAPEAAATAPAPEAAPAPAPAPRREPRPALAVLSKAGGQVGTEEKPKFLLTGRVRNDGDAPAEGVSVHVKLFVVTPRDVTGTNLAERDGPVSPSTLKPGETGSYRIEYAGEHADAVSRFEVEARSR